MILPNPFPPGISATAAAIDDTKVMRGSSTSLTGFRSASQSLPGVFAFNVQKIPQLHELLEEIGSVSKFVCSQSRHRSFIENNAHVRDILSVNRSGVNSFLKQQILFTTFVRSLSYSWIMSRHLPRSIWSLMVNFNVCDNCDAKIVGDLLHVPYKK